MNLVCKFKHRPAPDRTLYKLGHTKKAHMLPCVNLHNLRTPVSTISSHIQLRAGRSAGSSQSLNTRPLLFATAGARWPAISRALVVPPPPCLLREIEWEILRFSDPR